MTWKARELKGESEQRLSANQIEFLTGFNDEHRPINDRKFLGHAIPPYFIYDYEFDGMLYHHAWDMAVWFADFVMPEAAGQKGRAKSY